MLNIYNKNFYFLSHRLLPWWKEWTYCKGLKLITNSLYYENSTWLGIQNIYRKTDKEKFETKFIEDLHLVCSEDPNFIMKYLNLVDDHIKLYYNLHNENNITYFLFTIARHANKDKIFNFILNKFEEIKPK